LKRGVSDLVHLQRRRRPHHHTYHRASGSRTRNARRCGGLLAGNWRELGTPGRPPSRVTIHWGKHPTPLKISLPHRKNKPLIPPLPPGPRQITGVPPPFPHKHLRNPASSANSSFFL
jgi:hypothetical protein